MMFYNTLGTLGTVIYLESPSFCQIISPPFFYPVRNAVVILHPSAYGGPLPRIGELWSQRASAFLRLLMPTDKWPSGRWCALTPPPAEPGAPWRNRKAWPLVCSSLVMPSGLFTGATVSRSLDSLFVFLFFPFVSFLGFLPNSLL